MTDPDADGLLAEQLLRLTRRVHRIQKRHLEPVGITPAQGRLLRVVAHYAADAPPRMADIAARLEVVPRQVTTLVDGLEAAGCVLRVPDPANRRVTRIQLTEAGRATLRRLRNARTDAAEEILAQVFLRRGEIDLARRHFERALAIDPSYAPAVDGLRSLRR